MAAPALLRTLALIAGVTLIVIGVGTALIGYNQTQLAAHWASQIHYCGSAIGMDAARQLKCPTNPYAGGGIKIGLGILLAIGGGITARYGAT